MQNQKKKMNNKMKKINKTIIFIFVFFLFFTFGTRIIKNDLVYVSLEEVYECKRKLIEEELYIGELKNSIFSMKKEIERYSSASEKGREKILEYRTEIDLYKEKAGFENLEGEGVLVIVDDGYRELIDEEDPSNIVVHDVDVRKLINELFNAGAEAVSVNGNRIILGISEIQCNGPTIRINDVQQSRPYIIKAIGDKYRLTKELLAHESYGSKLMKYGVQFELVSKDNVSIKAYKGNTIYKYAKITED